MPNLLKNDKVQFICCRDFVYAGEHYTYGQDFPQEIGHNVETLVRARYIIPVVEKWADKPRHWHQHIRLKSEALTLMERKSGVQINTDPPKDVEPGDFNQWDETEDAGATIHAAMIRTITERKEEDPDMTKREVTFIDGNEESEPVALVNPDPEHEPEVTTELVEEPVVELTEEQEEAIRNPQGTTDYNPDGTATSTHDYSDQDDSADEDKQQLKDDTSAKNDSKTESKPPQKRAAPKGKRSNG